MKPPPLSTPMMDKTGNITMPWQLWFNSVYYGDQGTSWTPTFSGLGSTGTPTLTGRYYRFSQRFVYFTALITPATDTTSTAGTTYINNFPLVIKADGSCLAESGAVGFTPGICVASSNRIYTPGWSLITTPVTVSGLIEAQ